MVLAILRLPTTLGDGDDNDGDDDDDDANNFATLFTSESHFGALSCFGTTKILRAASLSGCCGDGGDDDVDDTDDDCGCSLFLEALDDFDDDDDDDDNGDADATSAGEPFDDDAPLPANNLSTSGAAYLPYKLDFLNSNACSLL